MTPYLLRLEAALEALGKPHVEVHSAPSPQVEQLLQQQTRLIEGTLVPLVQSLARQRGGG
jgi:hypothetical protein